MQRSSERILTTHVGSLARPHDLLEVMREKEHGRPYDPARFTEMVTEAVRDVVRRQAEAGLDVVTDGEMGKVSFLTYVKERLAGFDQVEGETLLPPVMAAIGIALHNATGVRLRDIPLTAEKILLALQSGNAGG